jgi:hypothetical protein
LEVKIKLKNRRRAIRVNQKKKEKKTKKVSKVMRLKKKKKNLKKYIWSTKFLEL